MKIGINTFGLGKLPSQDFEGIFRSLKEIGYSSVEPIVVFSGAMGRDPDQIVKGLKMSGQTSFWVDQQASENIKRIREMGLAVEGVHLGLVGLVPGGLKTVLPYLGDFARENGLSFFVHSPQKETIETVQADVAAFREGIRELKEQGVELLFHCHHDEFADDNGNRVFDYLMQEIPELRVELDVGWVQYAGVDPVALMKQYPGRMAIIHFKDFADSGRDKDFCAIGEGKLPLREIIQAAKNLSLYDVPFIIDQDASDGDMVEDLRTGYTNIRNAED